MNTPGIGLPPLPAKWEPKLREFVELWGCAAIEADRKRRGEPVAWPTHEFAIVIDRFYEGEGPSLAMWNGESYQFSDGDHDLYRGEDGSLGGYTAEWLTHRELERRLFCSQQIVKIPYWFSAPVTQEPVAFLCRECDEEGWSTYAVMPHEVPSTGEFLHVEPLYASPVAAQAQPAEPDRGEPVAYHPCTSILIEGLKRLPGGSAILAEWDKARSKVDAPQPAEPVKVPSDKDILKIWADTPMADSKSGDAIKFARAILARYGGK